MAICKVCGKKGFFLKVNADGRCADCGKIYMQNFDNAKNFYDNVSAMLEEMQRDLTEEDNVSSDIALANIQSRIDLCQSLKQYLDSYDSYPMLKDVLEKNDFGWQLPTYYSCNGSVVEVAIAQARHCASRCEKLWSDVKKSFVNNIEFEKALSCIRRYECKISNNPIDSFNVSGLSVKFTNVVSRSNFLKLGTFVVVDTETTGLNCGYDKIIELGAIKFEDWVPVQIFSTFINPGKSIPQSATNINHITDDFVSNAPSIEQIIPCFSDFCSDFNFVGHNLNFDLRFFYKSGFDFLNTKNRKYYDTLSLARNMLNRPNDVPNHKLDTLCEYYQIRENFKSHRVASDCLATGLLFQHLCSERTQTPYFCKLYKIPGM